MKKMPNIQKMGEVLRFLLAGKSKEKKKSTEQLFLIRTMKLVVKEGALMMTLCTIWMIEKPTQGKKEEEEKGERGARWTS